MSDKARRSIASVIFNGTDITKDIRPYFLSASHTDNEEDESDDLQITIEDRESVWLKSWLQEALNAAATTYGGGSASANEPQVDYPTVSFGSHNGTVSTMQAYLVQLGESLPVYGVDSYFGSETQAAVKSFQSKNPPLVVDGICGPKTWAEILKQIDKTVADSNASVPKLIINASFLRENWNGLGDNKLLDCGAFELDSVSCSGPPATITLKATSLPYSSQIRQTKLTKAWEKYSLSKIANEMASKNGMSVMYLSGQDPYYDRVEQYRMSDIAFLSTLCHRQGISLKATSNMLVLFDQDEREAVATSFTFRRGDNSYTKYKLMVGEADVQYAACRVTYVNPGTGGCISGTATVDDFNASAKNNQQLNIYAAVSSVSEAIALARKKLREHNKFEKTCVFTMPGNPDMVAGVTVKVSGFGVFDGKYIIKQSKHSIGEGGYTTQVTLRPVLGGTVSNMSSSQQTAAKTTYSVGDVVQFHGGAHYTNSQAARAAQTNVPAGPAKITQTNPGSKHPWHLIHTDSATWVYGWVDDGSFS